MIQWIILNIDKACIFIEFIHKYWQILEVYVKSFGLDSIPGILLIILFHSNIDRLGLDCWNILNLI